MLDHVVSLLHKFCTKLIKLSWNEKTKIISIISIKINPKGAGETPPQEFESLPTQSAPLCTILRYIFWVTYPKNFLKAPKYTNFEGGAHTEKTRLFDQNFPKIA